MPTNCTLGNVYTTNCTVISTTQTPCVGETSFQKQYFCKYCWQLVENVHYTCNYFPPKRGCQSGQDTYVTECKTNWNVYCLGNRTFQKIVKCNYTTGKTWASAFVYSLL